MVAVGALVGVGLGVLVGLRVLVGGTGVLVGRGVAVGMLVGEPQWRPLLHLVGVGAGFGVAVGDGSRKNPPKDIRSDAPARPSHPLGPRSTDPRQWRRPRPLWPLSPMRMQRFPERGSSCSN